MLSAHLHESVLSEIEQAERSLEKKIYVSALRLERYKICQKKSHSLGFSSLKGSLFLKCSGEIGKYGQAEILIETLNRAHTFVVAKWFIIEMSV